MSHYEVVKTEALKIKGVETQLPVCADLLSAGDDFFSKDTVTIEPQTAHLFWTDIKAKLEADEVLFVTVRSSVGTKKHLMLSNTLGVIDSSYFSNEGNDGNIGISLFNYGSEPVTIEVGERIAQGIVQKFVSMNNRNPMSDTRIGGFGSSNKTK